jgi:fluoride exporter
VTPAPSPRLLAAVALGGACGAVLRWALGEAFPDGVGFPWTVFAINVAGSFALAALPALAVVRRSPVLAVGLGTGLLGGFTTLSACSDQTRALLDAGDGALAAAYLLGTLGAALVAVALADRLSSPADRFRLEEEGADE